MEKMKVGVIGCGAISDIYLKNMTEKFDNLEVIACAARHMESAKKKAAQYGITACSVEDLLQNEAIQMVVILTPAHTHFELIKRALEAGKHVYTEKTITIDRESAAVLLRLAEEKKLYLGAAPDTFLGASHQTAKKYVDAGELGTITGFEICANRDLNFLTSLSSFLNQPGGGIGYDYGVYYLTALVDLLGPVEKVFAVVKNLNPVRTNILLGSTEYGKNFQSPNESQIFAVLEMASGVTGTFVLNGESVLQDQAMFTIQGSEGMMRLTDPNQFGGKNMLLKNGYDFDDPETWQIIDNEFPYSENSRGIGPSEMAAAIAHGTKNRANKEMAYHVLDVVETMMLSSTSGKFETVGSMLTASV
ncbi:MAG: Gfo/Idh/MocA family oxidoreductase [Clostridia bacterium]|nr:Gfo/Idh/MocA family oxidoreductase [Clostridia bacterium]